MGGAKGVTLRFTISLLVIGAVLLTAIIGGYSALNSTRQSLSTNYLESNAQYAKKLSSETHTLLSAMQMKIDYIAALAKDQTFTQEEMDLLLEANNQYFNSIVVVSPNRVVRHSSPADSVEIGTQIKTEASIQAIEMQKPFISEPYISTSGALILLVSSPIFSEEGRYEGYVGGTIYFEEENALSQMLSEHFYGDGSYVFVVDKRGNLLFHPDQSRINEHVLDNEVIDEALAGEEGFREITNSKGIDYFIGYTREELTGWGIFSQTPTTVLAEPLSELVGNMIVKALPFFVVILLAAWWVTFSISKPLHKLAKFSEDAILHKKASPVQFPKINSKIYEVRQLYQHITNHIDQLHVENQMDGLTGLANRRTFEWTMDEWVQHSTPFSLILLDVDRFKLVNDRYGHIVGDDVLRYLASMMRTVTRGEDFNFRFGGEEFGILVKGADQNAAISIAERLRKQMEKSISPTVEAVTISLGISHYPDDGLTSNEMIEKADAALYQSKAAGRNRTSEFSATAGQLNQ